MYSDFIFPKRYFNARSEWGHSGLNECCFKEIYTKSGLHQTVIYFVPTTAIPENAHVATWFLQSALCSGQQRETKRLLVEVLRGRKILDE